VSAVAAMPGRRSRRTLGAGLWPALPAVIFLMLFFLLPLAENGLQSLYLSGAAGKPVFSLDYYVRLFTDGYYLGVLFRMIWVSLLATIICILIGYPVAYFMVRYAVIIGLVHVLVPLMVISIAAVLKSVDTRLEEAAELLGASRWRTFLEITLPLSLDGIATGAIVVFMLANGSFLTMLLLGGGSVVTLPLDLPTVPACPESRLRRRHGQCPAGSGRDLAVPPVATDPAGWGAS